MNDWLALLPGYRALTKRLEAERDDARAQRDRILEELHIADQTIERFIDENAALKAQVEVLVQERSKVDEVHQATVATNVTQDSAKDRPVRNAQKRAGAARKEP